MLQYLMNNGHLEINEYSDHAEMLRIYNRLSPVLGGIFGFGRIKVSERRAEVVDLRTLSQRVGRSSEMGYKFPCLLAEYSMGGSGAPSL